MELQPKKHFFLAFISSYFSTVLSIVVSIISVPISIKYFGTVKFGAIAIINTVLTYLTITNFGIHTAAGVLGAKALNNEEKLKVIAKSFVLLLAIVLPLLVLLMVYRNSDIWVNLLGKIPFDIHDEVKRAVFFAAVLFLINYPLNLIITSGFTAIYKVHIDKLYGVLSSTVMTFVALIATLIIRGNLVDLFVIRGLLIIAASLAGAIHFCIICARQYNIWTFGLLSPSKEAEFSVYNLLLTGFRFFFIGLAAMVVWNTDNFVISHFIGIEAVTPYSITFRVCSITFFVFTSLNAALPSMYGKYYADRNYEWIQNTYNKITLFSPIIGGLIWIGSILFVEDIINVWIGPEVYGGMLVVFALGGYGYSLSLVHAHASLINGTNLIKNGIKISWSEAIVNILLSLLLVGYLGIGGVALGTFLGAILTVFWLIPYEIYRRTDGNLVFNYKPILEHFLTIVFPCLVLAYLIVSISEAKIIQISSGLLLMLLYLFISYRKTLTADNKELLNEYLVKFLSSIKITRFAK